MNHLASCVVSQYLQEDFIPATQKAIQQAVANKKAALIIPALVTNKVISSIVKPSLQNASKAPFYPSPGSTIIQTPQLLKQPDTIRVPYRKHRSVMSKPTSQTKSVQEEGEKRSARSNSRVTTQSTALIKLPSDNEEQDEQIIKIRKMKALSKKFEKMREENRLYNQKMHKLAKYHKQSSLNECPYHSHTYDYEADIVGVVPSSISDFPQPIEEKSLLQIIKNNLDKQLENEKIKKKVEEIHEISSKQRPSDIAPGHISRLQQVDGTYLPVKNKPPQPKKTVDRALKPPFNFEKSSIRSLSKSIQDSFISEGVKMITHQEHLVEEKSKKTPLFRIQQQEIIKQKPRGLKKQKTHTSQSVIYSLQNELKNHSVLDIYTNLVRQSTIEAHSNYQSLQHNRQVQNQQYDALTELLKRHSKHLTIDVESRVEYSHFPSINRSQRRSHLKKRTSTQQKPLKGLQGIDVQVSTPQMKQDFHFSHRSAHNSALAIKRQTQSSLEEPDNDGVSRKSSQKSKKQYVRGYFRNYKQQFRHKLKGIEQALKMYS